jgi:hypothetical protein
MPTAFLLQLGISAAFIAVMVAVTAVARIPRTTPPLDEAALRRLLRDDYPEVSPDALWISRDGRGGVAAAGDAALIAFPLGDGYVTRDMPWADLSRAGRTDTGVRLRFPGPGGGDARLNWSGETPWPPERP